MTEFVLGGSHGEDPKYPFKGDSAEADDDAGPYQVDLALEVGLAICELLGAWFVGRRCAAPRSGQIQPMKPETIVAGDGQRPIGVAGAMECRVQEIPRGITGKLPAGPI